MNAVKRCTVAYALADRQWLWPLELPADATVAEALAAAQRATAVQAAPAGEPDVPWDSAVVGVFGIECPRDLVFADGDRIEIYRPLAADPRAARRARVAGARKAGGRKVEGKRV